MKTYQLTYLISPDASDEETKALQEKLSSFISSSGGIVAESTLPVRKNLAYPIKKAKVAFLADLNFRLAPDKLEGLEKEIRAEKKILRHLLIFKNPEKFSRQAARKRMPKPQKVEMGDLEKKIDEILGQ